MFTSVLSAIDFSEPSIRALHYAVGLASRKGGRLTLIHVAHPLLVEAAAAAFDLTFVKDESERELRSVASDAVEKVPGASLQTDILVSVGDPASEILKCAHDRRADCIVMGTQGLSGYQKMFFGSVTEHVLRRSPVPVLAVPTGEPLAAAEGLAQRIGRVMAAVDFSDRSSDNVSIALEFAKELSVPVLVVHVVSSIRGTAKWRETLAAHERILLARARTKMESFIASLATGVKIETVVTTGSPADEIGAIAAEHNVGLIVMGLVGTAGLLGARPGSVAYRVLCLAASPVLAVRRPRLMVFDASALVGASSRVLPTVLTGLSDEEAQARLAADGPNELPAAQPKSLVVIAAEVLREPMLLLLLATGAVYLVLGDLEEALALLAAVFVVVGITLYQEQKTERTLYALRDLSSPRALVVRRSRTQRIAGREVVREDLVVLSEGDRVPADAIVMSSTNLRVDESLLTGESVPVDKTADGSTGPRAEQNEHVVYSGTLIVSGHGTARVTATGARTKLGQIGKALSALEIGRTPLQREVAAVVRLLAVLGLSACVLVAVIYAINRGRWIDGALAGLTLAISMVPEEFPVILTVFLALGAWRISKNRVLTRRLPAIETLGSTTVLCVDKTGTLTLNRMAIAAIYTGGKLHDIGSDDVQPLPDNLCSIIDAGVLASKERPFDPMERAFVDFSAQHCVASQRVGWTLLREYPLSDRLLAVTNVWRASPDSDVVAVKGAPEAVAELCHITAVEHAELFQHVSTMAQRGLRVLAIARGEHSGTALPETAHGFSLSYLGLVGLADPVRPGVPGAVQECKDAGMRVVMLTGDYPGTALAIASQIGLARSASCMTGPELAELDDQALQERVRTVNVFARVVPEQKLRLVTALKANGEIVAMTGDGVNDAPALKAADVGIAMGSRGTDVAREAAALVLLDDDFTSIVRAARLGRRIYDNIRKAMAYVLAIHVPIAGISVVPVLFNWPLVLLPLHVVFMEMIVDPTCSVAFEREPDEANVMWRPPRDPRQPLFERHLVLRSLIQGLSGFAIVLAVLLGARQFGLDPLDVRTLTFNTLVTTNLALIFTNRSLTRTFFSAWSVPNPALWWVIGSALLLLNAVMFVPPLRDMFQLARPHWDDLLVCAITAVVAIVWMDVVKMLDSSRSRQIDQARQWPPRGTRPTA